jgi:hypothetical protein
VACEGLVGTVGRGGGRVGGVERGTVPSSVAKRMVGSVWEGMVRVWGGWSERRGEGGLCW